ncbi:FAD-dependent monooxygenase [Mucilaginibacter sp. UR6-1]|uniref:FAD-dependent oxidoreductase n=1 Tax=Mucilaginibacter sp. UR6-1 TaxID=1435643 RepID=UPI001E55BD10|nr:NAD(P)/FAD-dependent oxidoreductase [Mucilaginibacter sp. UR6-1]MCC8411057.1 FAD-dependent monooxygenase [Mucilaginibacter sp. UR6-1]
MLIKDRKVAIVGGGPGGLTLAKLLQLKGAAIKIYERDADRHARQQGATLDLHDESGLKALRHAGLIEAFKKHYRPGADKLIVTDKDLNTRYTDHDGRPEGEFGQEHFRPEIDRGPLRDILINSLADGTIEWDSQYASAQRVNSGWQINFKNGKTANADIIIAADGANSALRHLVSDIKPVYSNVTVIEGNIYNAAVNVPVLNERVNGGKIFALGAEKTIVLSAKGDGALSFYTGTREAEDWLTTSGIDFKDKNSVFAWFKTRFADWSTQWHELFATDDMYVVPRPMYHYPIDQHWETQPDITLLGDAAHRMPPYAGEGVNMAMLDALELAEALTDPAYVSVQQAIAAYEKQMLARAAEVTALTLEQTESMHSPGALEHVLNLWNGGE